MAYIRTVRTGSGATAVQLVAKRRGRRWVLEHFGSAHDEVELAVLVAAARDRLEQFDPSLDLGIEVPARAARMVPAPVTDQLGVAVAGGGSGAGAGAAGRGGPQ